MDNTPIQNYLKDLQSRLSSNEQEELEYVLDDQPEKDAEWMKAHYKINREDFKRGLYIYYKYYRFFNDKGEYIGYEKNGLFVADTNEYSNTPIEDKQPDDDFYCKEWDKVGFQCEEQCKSCAKTKDFVIEEDKQEQEVYKWVKPRVPDNFPETLDNAIFRDAITQIQLSPLGYLYDNYTFRKVDDNVIGKSSYDLDEVEWLKPVTIPEQVTNDYAYCESCKKCRPVKLTFFNPDEDTEPTLLVCEVCNEAIYFSNEPIKEQVTNEEIAEFKRQLSEQSAAAIMNEQGLLALNRRISEEVIDKAISFCNKKIEDITTNRSQSKLKLYWDGLNDVKEHLESLKQNV